jgi:hypothetical protein
MQNNTTTKHMENKTAMQQLKEKIQVVIGEMNGELSSYESGYKQCLINIQNDIDLQMMAMEKEQMEDTWIAAHQAGRFEGKGIAEEDWQTFTQYYIENYGK